MGDAFECDRCKKLYKGQPKQVTDGKKTAGGYYNWQDKELCRPCARIVKLVIIGHSVDASDMSHLKDNDGNVTQVDPAK